MLIERYQPYLNPVVHATHLVFSPATAFLQSLNLMLFFVSCIVLSPSSESGVPSGVEYFIKYNVCPFIFGGFLFIPLAAVITCLWIGLYSVVIVTFFTIMLVRCNWLATSFEYNEVGLRVEQLKVDLEKLREEDDAWIAAEQAKAEYEHEHQRAELDAKNRNKTRM